MKILVPREIADKGKNYLINNGHELLFYNGVDHDDLLKNIENADGLIIRTAKVDTEALSLAKNLKVIAKHGVGVDNINVEKATELGIQVVNAPESNSNAVAEHTITLMLSLSKNILPCYLGMQKGNYAIRDQLQNIELKGKNLGLIGFGNIGKLVAKKAFYGLDMNVSAFDPCIKSSPEFSFVSFDSDWDKIFSTSDYISLHLPLSEKTKNIVSEKELNLMQAGASIINAARGGVINEKALYNALKENKIKSAALDVFSNEPLHSDSYLFDLDNILLSPHNAALTKDSLDNMSYQAAQGIIEYFNKGLLTWPVNKI